ncbi:hypothetical protein FA13DRAFT_131344 [Coprinellus micaceus]|uniref:Xylose isomerase-like TIM barrel domain-containing protein n=1 Tax=Coprinellus micaceus TaxID=71717 RepID=A0A4Y7SJM5_COPMI|nr:hypothetical protein FA13DRAFT_131344 [Coprinellus micaceus]
MKQFQYETGHVLPHGNYLVNLGNPDRSVPSLSDSFGPASTPCPFLAPRIDSMLTNVVNMTKRRMKSYDCFDDLRRCEALGLRYYNFHPCSTLGQTTREESIRLIGESLDEVHRATSGVVTVIENTVGHPYAAKFDEITGIKYLVGVHLDDSKTPCRRRQDRHENLVLCALPSPPVPWSSSFFPSSSHLFSPLFIPALPPLPASHPFFNHRNWEN